VTVQTEQGLFRIARENASLIEGLALSEDGTGHQGEFNEKAVWYALRTCFDPEIPVNIVDLGLIYDLAIEKAASGANVVEVKMTLTAPGCGMGPVIAEDARQKIASLPSVESAKVHIVWDPIWNPKMISEAGRRSLGLE
jgi:probable FeS assembly SUF system protein SufT